MKRFFVVSAVMLLFCVTSALAQTGDTVPWTIAKTYKHSTSDGGEVAIADGVPQKYLSVNVNFASKKDALTGSSRFRVVDARGAIVGKPTSWNVREGRITFEGNWASLEGLYLDGLHWREPLFQMQVAQPVRPQVTTTVPQVATTVPNVTTTVVDRPGVYVPPRVIDRGVTHVRNRDDVIVDHGVTRVYDDRDRVIVHDGHDDVRVVHDDVHVVHDGHDRVIHDDHDTVVHVHDDGHSHGDTIIHEGGHSHDDGGDVHIHNHYGDEVVGDGPACAPGTGEGPGCAPGEGPGPGCAPGEGCACCGAACKCSDSCVCKGGSEGPCPCQAACAPGEAPGPGPGPGPGMGPGPGGPGPGPGGPGGPGEACDCEPGQMGQYGMNGQNGNGQFGQGGGIQGLSSKNNMEPAFVLYVATGEEGGPGKVYQVNEHGRILGWVNLPHTPSSIALHRENGLVVSLPRDGGKIVKIDDTGKAETILEKDKNLVHPVDVAIGGDTDVVVIADNLSDVISATSYGGQTPKEYRRFEDQQWTAQTMSVAVTKDGHVIYGTDGGKGIYRFSGNDPDTVEPILPEAGGVAADPKTLRWAATQSPNQVYVFEGEEHQQTLRLPPGKSLYKQGLLSFGPEETVVVAGRDSDSLDNEPWLFMIDPECGETRSLFPWTKEKMTDFVVGPRMFWERNSPNTYRSTY